MTKYFAPLAVATVMMVAGSSFANAWTRSSSTTGPNGRTASHQGSGLCSGGKCTSKQTFTGPNGNTATRSGNTTCSGGSCKGGATYTGPAGNTVTRSRSTNY